MLPNRTLLYPGELAEKKVRKKKKKTGRKVREKSHAFSSKNK
jgi:hypothetical protein